MAVNALISLAKDHIWVLRTIWPKDRLHDKLKNDTKWGLKTIIKSLGNAANMKAIKAEVAPGILSPGEWTSWSGEARKILKTDPDFGTFPEKADHYVVRENPITYEEKTFNIFRAEKSFWARLKTTQEYLANSDPESDYFAEMFDYFAGFLKTYSAVNEIVISCWLLVRNIVAQYPFLNPGIDLTFESLIDDVEDLESVFSAIEDSDLKRSFLQEVQTLDDWPSMYVQLFPYYMNKFIIDQLIEHEQDEMLKDLVETVVANYRENRAAYCWLAKTMPSDLFLQYNISVEKILIGMIHLLDITYREIENRRDVGENRKLNRQVLNFLFKEKNVESYIENADEDSASRIFTLVEDVGSLDHSLKLGLKQKILNRFPNFKFYGAEKLETTTVTRRLLVTAQGYEEHTGELQRILEVEVPNNSKEISAALEYGDLRENAEYKAAKEKQDFLNSTAARMKEEIEKAQIFDPKDIDTSKVSFSTTVTLKNKKTQNDEVYTILGPWESNPSESIISYLSPFGSALWQRTVGEDLDFEINDREYSYEVKEIKEYAIEGVTS